LNIDFEIKNGRQDCKIGTVCEGGTCGSGEGERRDEGEEIRLMSFIYTYEIE
jgi:hypothetical protein